MGPCHGIIHGKFLRSSDLAHSIKSILIIHTEQLVAKDTKAAYHITLYIRRCCLLFIIVSTDNLTFENRKQIVALIFDLVKLELIDIGYDSFNMSAYSHCFFIFLFFYRSLIL